MRFQYLDKNIVINKKTQLNGVYIYDVPDVVVFWQDQVAKDKVMQSMSSMSSAQIISASVFQNKMALQGLSRPAYSTAAGVSAPEHFTSLMLWEEG